MAPHRNVRDDESVISSTRGRVRTPEFPLQAPIYSSDSAYQAPFTSRVSLVQNLCDFLRWSANHSSNQPLLSSPEMIDHAATTLIILDDKETFLSLVERHGGIVRKVAAGYSSGLADRHDLMQEIMLQLWKAYPRYSPERPFSTWMYRIALNVAVSFLRRNTHPVRKAISLDEAPMDFADENTSPPATDDRIPVLQQVIASLAPLDRALLLLYLDEHSYREISAILGITETNVATKLNRLKQSVREEMLKLTQ